MARKGHRRTTGPRTVAVLAFALVASSAAGTAHSVQPAGEDNRASEWGTVIDTPDGLQATAWAARLSGLGDINDAKLLETADPATPSVPNSEASKAGPVDVAPAGVRIGQGSDLSSRAFRNQVPQDVSGEETTAAPGTAYADSGGAKTEIGLPYTAQSKGGTQPSGISVNVDACRATAISLPRKPVQLDGGSCRGYISLMGQKAIDIPAQTPINFGARIQAGQDGAPLAIVTINEQVTTDKKGRPTLGPDKKYRYDPRATSGYVNGVHISVLGPEVSDATLWHAAVIRDPSKTDKINAKPQLPGFLQRILARQEPDAKKPLPQFPADATWAKDQYGQELWSGKLPQFDEDDS
ncbi:hypothetical protein [Streptomyces luteolus]|uniref:Uncharacterized protein n=1 Tax=Streptomyces luteolus TaxID=3043615 RepID=A0ABT6T891_9ACTN|nr:hypothetical protein [Streptomyces sp. B-S-A12]MDI3424113.1 hypothetical protein [Streptomyces sp. B-S-A12]